MYQIMIIIINIFNNMLFWMSYLKKVFQITFSIFDTLDTAYTVHFCTFLLCLTNKCTYMSIFNK